MLTLFRHNTNPFGTYFFLAVDCGPLSVPMNGSSSGDSTVFPNNILFNCDPGFILSGSFKRMCRPNGTWSGFVTKCTGRSQRTIMNILCFTNVFCF